MNLTYNQEAESIPEAVGISKERLEELDYRMALILHDFHRPTRDHVSPPFSQIFMFFIALAENEAELSFLAFEAGIQVQRLIQSVSVIDNDFEELE